MVVRELERKIVQLEQHNKELGDLLKELREAQINNGGANSLRRLEEVHKHCASIVKSKESQWGDQVAKMEADIVTYKSTLTNKEQEIRELQMELENCYYAIEENHLGLLIFKSELVEAYSKSCRGRADLDKAFDIKENEDVVLISAEQLRVKDKSVKTMAQAAQQHYLLEEEPKQQKKKLEESSEGQLILEEQLLQMEYTVQYERNAAFEALEVLEQEIAMDVANGKQRHIPYRDSRLTFLLQEELSILKRRQNVSRSLSFSLSSIRDIKQSLELEDCCLENATDMVDQHEDNMPNYESKGIRMSHKQVYMGRLGYVNEG
ncbi:hypothetical protein JHK86_048015 [Glycine max]|nr:hypothetical protein JHK86_048015 [Glycine max]